MFLKVSFESLVCGTCRVKAAGGLSLRKCEGLDSLKVPAEGTRRRYPPQFKRAIILEKCLALRPLKDAKGTI